MCEFQSSSNNLQKDLLTHISEAPEEWIITKNDKGTVKFASCKEDESGIYDKTRDWTVSKKVQNALEGDDDNKEDDPKTNALFFIRDLLNAKEIHSLFKCKSIQFRRVFICGIVVAKSQKDENYFLQVDDGTSNIKCIINSNNLKNLKTMVDKSPYEKLLCNDQNSVNVFIKAARITLSSISNLQNSTPTWEELELGDVVKIIGKLSEYNNGRYIFIKKISKESKGSRTLNSHLDHMIHLYSEVYTESSTFNK